MDHINPCNPSPCGANAICKEQNGAGSCSCVAEYFGDPYIGCRPECVQNSECDRSRACVNNKCKDPCPGVCGINAECYVQNHSPTCNCIPGYTGNANAVCNLLEPGKYTIFILWNVIYIYFFTLLYKYFISLHTHTLYMINITCKFIFKYLLCISYSFT